MSVYVLALGLLGAVTLRKMPLVAMLAILAYIIAGIFLLAALHS